MLLLTTCWRAASPQADHGHQHSPAGVKPSSADRVAIPFAPLQPLRRWLSALEIRDRNMAQLLCRVIPAQCPFERTFTLFGHTILAIPPLCKLNPLYEELVTLRFRSLCYLAEVLGEDISRFC